MDPWGTQLPASLQCRCLPWTHHLRRKGQHWVTTILSQSYSRLTPEWLEFYMLAYSKNVKSLFLEHTKYLMSFSKQLYHVRRILESCCLAHEERRPHAWEQGLLPNRSGIPTPQSPTKTSLNTTVDLFYKWAWAHTHTKALRFLFLFVLQLHFPFPVFLLLEVMSIPWNHIHTVSQLAEESPNLTESCYAHLKEC
jgi:hypothetical protein